MPDLQQAIDQAQGDRTALIDAIIAAMEKRLGLSQQNMFDSLITGFVDKLDKTPDGKIADTQANRDQFAQLNNLFDSFTNTEGVAIAATMVAQIDKIFAFNESYFGNLTTDATLGNILPGTVQQIEDWLGITNKGGLVENGYLQRVVTDPTIRDEVRDAMFQAIVTQRGYNETKAALRDYILGIDDEGGALQKYYRNFVYDTFSQVDRTQSNIVAQKLDLQYAIYEGGLIKTSRPFCRERNGKVFTYEEIAAFDPPTAKQDNYNPFTDLGAYGCRHHLNYIPKSLAEILRPDLKTA